MIVELNITKGKVYMITLIRDTQTLKFNRCVEAYEYGCENDLTGFVIKEVVLDAANDFIPPSNLVPRIKIQDRQGTFDIQTYFKSFVSVGDRVVAYGHHLNAKFKSKSDFSNQKLSLASAHNPEPQIMTASVTPIVEPMAIEEDHEQLLNPSLEQSRPAKSRKSKKKVR
jgi:hypothetical protein